MTDTNTAPRAARTLTERKAALEEQLAKVNRLINAEAILASIAVGDTVTFNFGRGEKARVLTGVVKGLRDVEVGKGTQRQAAIEAGDGFESETYRVPVASILTINGGEAIEQDDEAADASADASNDPLAAE